MSEWRRVLHSHLLTYKPFTAPGLVLTLRAYSEVPFERPFGQSPGLDHHREGDLSEQADDCSVCGVSWSGDEITVEGSMQLGSPTRA